MDLNSIKLDRYGDHLFLVDRWDDNKHNRNVLDDIVDELNDLNDRIERLEMRDRD